MFWIEWMLYSKRNLLRYIAIEVPAIVIRIWFTGQLGHTEQMLRCCDSLNCQLSKRLC
jgi:hypothetical protein